MSETEFGVKTSLSRDGTESVNKKSHQLLARDPVYLDKIFREINPVLFRVLASQRITGETAEDLVHQTWEKFFANLEQFEGRSEVQTFICGILFNKIREHRRMSGRTVYEEDSERFLSHAFTPEGWWKTESPDPVRLVQSRQLSSFITECLEGLTEQQKTAFVLKEVEQEGSQEICNVLGVTVSHLRVLIFRAKDKLRQCLEGRMEAEDF